MHCFLESVLLNRLTPSQMVLELGDEAVVTNDKTDYSCRTEFKTKGFVFGDYNDIAGKVKHGSTSVADIDGKWSDTMYIKKRVSSLHRHPSCLGLQLINSPLSSQNDHTKQVFFDSHSAGVPKKSVTPESDQLENESRRYVACHSCSHKTLTHPCAPLLGYGPVLHPRSRQRTSKRPLMPSRRLKMHRETRRPRVNPRSLASLSRWMANGNLTLCKHAV